MLRENETRTHHSEQKREGLQRDRIEILVVYDAIRFWLLKPCREDGMIDDLVLCEAFQVLNILWYITDK